MMCLVCLLTDQWDQVKDDCYTARQVMKADVAQAKQAVKKWWHGTA